MEKRISHPDYYAGKIECINVVAYYPFEIGCAIKYLWRAGKKDGESKEDDLKKALWYVENAYCGLVGMQRNWEETESSEYFEAFERVIGCSLKDVIEQFEEKNIRVALRQLLSVGLMGMTVIYPQMELFVAMDYIKKEIAK